MELLGPTAARVRHRAQKQRFLPPIARGDEIWCQGYSEPNAGSDLANVQHARAARVGADGSEWVIDGQKVWTSLGAVRRLDVSCCAAAKRAAARNKGLSYLLVPMRQPGVELRPIREMTGESRVQRDVLRRCAHRGREHRRCAGRRLEGRDGHARVRARRRRRSRSRWTSSNELAAIIAAARAQRRAAGPAAAPAHRRRAHRAQDHALQRAADADEQRRASSLSHEAYTYRSALGRLAQEARRARDGRARTRGGEIARHAPYELGRAAARCSCSRAPTRSTAASSQIQRNLIAERALGLPREPRGDP